MGLGYRGGNEHIRIKHRFHDHRGFQLQALGDLDFPIKTLILKGFHPGAGNILESILNACSLEAQGGISQGIIQHQDG